MRSHLSWIVLALQASALAACGGDGGGSTDAGADNVPPSAPAGLSGIPTGLKVAQLTWQPSTDSGAGVAGYRVYRDGVEIGSTSETSYTATQLAPGMRHAFTVRAFDAATPSNESPAAAAVQVAQPPEYVLEQLPIQRCTDWDRMQFDDQGRLLGLNWLYAGGAVTFFDSGPGWQNARAIDMNSSGQVVGSATFEIVADGGEHAFETHPFLFSEGMMTDLGNLGGTEAWAEEINDSGQVLLRSLRTPEYSGRSQVFSSGTFTDLGTLGGDWTVARDMNESGQVVGESNLSIDGVFHAFLFANGQMNDLGTLGGPASEALGLADSGHVHGRSSLPGDANSDAPFLYHDGVMTQIGTLGGSTAHVSGISDSGVVYGQSTVAGDASTHAFVFEDGMMTDLGTLGGKDSIALGINGAGQVFGTSTTDAEGTIHAFVYSGGVMTDLGTLDGGNIRPADMNESGHIVGNAPLLRLEDDRPFLYVDGRMWDLNLLIEPTENVKFASCGVYGTYGRGYFSVATHINNAGQIVVTDRICAPYLPGEGDRCRLFILTPRSPAAVSTEK